MTVTTPDNPSTLTRARRIGRQLPPVRSFNVLRKVVLHPANHGRRGRAVAAAIRWQVRSRRDPRPMPLEVYGGLTMLCYPRSGSASNIIYFTSYYDVQEMAFMRRYLRRGDAVVDAGANIGTYTLLAASLVGPTGCVLSFEPAPIAFNRLKENIDVNNLGYVRPIQAAVGAEPGTLPMRVSADVSSSLVNLRDDEATSLVDVVALDDVIETPVSFVKLDVEGFEAAALAGLQRTLTGASPPVVLLELVPHLLRRAGGSPEGIRDWLGNAGYELLRYDGRDLVPAEHLIGNLLAIRADDLGRVQQRLQGS